MTCTLASLVVSSRSSSGVAPRSRRAPGCGSGRSSRGGSRAPARSPRRPGIGKYREAAPGGGTDSIGQRDASSRSRLPPGRRSRARSRRSRGRASGAVVAVAALARRDVVLRPVRVWTPLGRRAASWRPASRSTRRPRRTTRGGGVVGRSFVRNRVSTRVAAARELLPQLRADREHPVVHVGRVDRRARRAAGSSAASSRRRRTARTAACTPGSRPRSSCSRRRRTGRCSCDGLRHQRVARRSVDGARRRLPAFGRRRLLSSPARTEKRDHRHTRRSASRAPERRVDSHSCGRCVSSGSARAASRWLARRLDAGLGHGPRRLNAASSARTTCSLRRRRDRALMWQPPAPGWPPPPSVMHTLADVDPSRCAIASTRARRRPSPW